MKKYLTLLIGALLATSVLAGIKEAKIIYGIDNRQDVEQMDDEVIKKIGESIAGRVRNSSFKVNLEENKISFDHVGTLSNPRRGRVCSDERFADQKTATDCTGFLVGEDLLVTAGHCVTDRDVSVRDQLNRKCAVFSWLFDYHASADLENIDFDKVYGCEKVIVAENTGTLDFALIKLKRKVEGRKPLVLSASNPSIGTKLFVMGHPSGLPLKFADGARVFETNKNYFGTNLDTFGGNSGSPVFNADTNQVEGILVRGDIDYVNWRDASGRICRRVNICTNDRENCIMDSPEILGEHVSFISFIKNLL